MTDHVGWGERGRDRIKACNEICDLDVIWTHAVRGQEHRGAHYQAVRWWLHWRMRQLVSMARHTMPAAYAAIPGGSTIERWPEEWWRPITPDERDASRERKSRARATPGGARSDHGGRE